MVLQLAEDRLEDKKEEKRETGYVAVGGEVVVVSKCFLVAGPL